MMDRIPTRDCEASPVYQLGLSGSLGPINRQTNHHASDGDLDLPLLLSLGHYTDKTNVTTQAAVLHEGTI